MVASLVLTGCKGEKDIDDSWEKIQEKGELVMGLDDSFPPMGFREDGEIVGFDVDVAKEVCSRLGIELKLQPINWDNKMHELNSGNIDCIWNGFTINEERKKEVLFTEPYMNNRQVLVVLADSEYQTIDDLKGKKIGLQAESSAADALNSAEDFRDSVEVFEFDDNMNALMDLEVGGVDAVLMDEVVANYNIAQKGKGYRVLDQELAHEEYGIGFRKKDKALMEKIQQTLEEMAEDGTLEQISIKWFDEDLTTIGK